MEHNPFKKYCILYGKCSHSTGKYKDLSSMVNKQKQKKKKNMIKIYRKSNKELNALIDKRPKVHIKQEKEENRKAPNENKIFVTSLNDNREKKNRKNNQK